MPQTSQSCLEWPRNIQERPRIAWNSLERPRKTYTGLEHHEMDLSIIEHLKTSENGLRVSQYCLEGS